MKNNEYLSEEKYAKAKKILIAIGCVSLVIGVGFLIASFLVDVPDMRTDGWFEASRQQLLLRFLAFPFGLMIPALTFSLAFGREIRGFQAQQQMPLAKEGIDKMAPTVGKAAGEIAKGIKDGLKVDDK